MDWKSALSSYCQGRFPFLAELPPPVPVEPWEAVELFFDLHPMFTARFDVINSVAYDPNFDGEADEALLDLARTNSFDGWQNMSAGAWRVMAARFTYMETVAAGNAAAGTEVMFHLPAGLGRESKTRALLIAFLLGDARTIPPKLLPKKGRGGFPAFPETKPIRPN